MFVLERLSISTHTPVVERNHKGGVRNGHKPKNKAEKTVPPSELSMPYGWLLLCWACTLSIVYMVDDVPLCNNAVLGYKDFYLKIL